MRIKLYGLEQPAVDSHGPAKYTVSLAEFIRMNTSGSQNGSKQQWAAIRKATSSVYTRVLTYIQGIFRELPGPRLPRQVINSLPKPVRILNDDSVAFSLGNSLGLNFQESGRITIPADKAPVSLRMNLEIRRRIPRGRYSDTEEWNRVRGTLLERVYTLILVPEVVTRCLPSMESTVMLRNHTRRALTRT